MQCLGVIEYKQKQTKRRQLLFFSLLFLFFAVLRVAFFFGVAHKKATFGTVFGPKAYVSPYHWPSLLLLILWQPLPPHLSRDNIDDVRDHAGQHLRYE